MNTITLIGRLTKTPDFKLTQNSQFVNFTLAVDRRFDKEKTDFFNCKCWGKQADVINQYVYKGDRLAVSGRLEIVEFDGKDGQKVRYPEIIVENFDLLEKKKESFKQSKPENVYKDEVGDDLINNDDLPF